jgi:superfamily II DNA or RNA helicase
MIQLRNYQQEAIGKLRIVIRRLRASNQPQRVLLQAATGSGKTVISCAMIKCAIAKGYTVLFLAHRKEIIIQTSGKLDGKS